MIDPKELRLGNKMEYFIGEEGLKWESCTIDWQDIKWCEEENENFNKVHRPIPLTEGWLRKTPFKEVPIDHPVPNHIAFELHGIHVKIYNTGQVAVWYQGQVIYETTILYPAAATGDTGLPGHNLFSRIGIPLKIKATHISHRKANTESLRDLP